MPSIDERVVAMAFENAKFESGVAVTMKSLGKLDITLQQIGSKNSLADIEKSANKVTLQQPMSALDKLKARLSGAGSGAAQGMSDIDKAGNKVTLNGPITALNKVQAATGQVGGNASRSFAEIENASSRVTLQGITSSLNSVQAKFSVLQGAAAVALGNIASKAVSTGTQVAKSLTLTPVMEGFHNYETQINAVQVIMSNTGLTGQKGLGKVQAALSDLNEYANKTVYNFSEMAKNIGTFTAAGVDLKTATGSIKGIANLAALSGSNSQQASTAMYQLSQAIAAGQVHLQDWNSVVNAGMGGKVFQTALARTAQAMGTLHQGSVKLVGPMKQLTINGESFRQALQSKPGEKSWLSSDVLTKTLQQFTGDMTTAQLKAEGFSAAQIKSIQSQGKAASAAATNIKTFTQLMQALKEEVATAWATIFKTVFGNIFDATKFFTKFHTAAQNALTGPIYAVNKVLQGWVKLGGRSILIEGLKSGMKDLSRLIQPVREAFRDIFPATTSKDLLNLTKNFKSLMDRLLIGHQAAENIRRTFRGVFSLLDIGKQIVLGIFHAFAQMFGEVGKGAGGVLGFSGTVGDLIVALDKWLKSGDRLKNFFGTIGGILAAPIHLIGELVGAITGLFATKDTGNTAAKGITGVTEALKPAEKVAQGVQNAWNGILHIFEKIGQVLAPVAGAIGDALSKIGDVLSNSLHGSFDNVFAGIQTGLIAGIFLAVRKAVFGGVGFSFKTEVKGLSGAFDTMTGTLKTMQTSIKANILLKIASAVALLAVSIVALSFVKPAKIASSMTAIAVGLAQLIAAMTILGTGKGKFGAVKASAIATSLILMATAIDVLSIAVIALSQLSWGQLAKGFVAIDVLLAILSRATPALSRAGPGFVLASGGIIAIGIALTILGGAMKIFATMKWGDMVKGLVGILLVLDTIRFATAGMGPQLLLIGPGLILLGVGLNIIAGALKIFATISWGDMVKGIVGIGAALVVIGLAMNTMPPTLPLTAAGLILVGIALTAIAGVIKLLGSMDISTLAKGIGAIAAALVVLAVGLTAMVASLPGAAALLVAAAALAILAPTLGLLGTMKWSTIAKGLAAIALSMAVIGIGGVLAAPGLIALGLGLSVLGIGMLAVGSGVYLMAKGLSLLAGDGAKGIAVVLAALTALIAVVPKIVIDFVKGIVDIVKGVAQLAPTLVTALTKILNTFIEVIIREIPRIGLAVGIFIQEFAKLIVQGVPYIVKAAYAIILGFLKGLDDNIGLIVGHGISIVVKLISAIASAAPRLVVAGATMLANFISGLANNIGRIVSAAAHLITKFLSSLTERLPRIISSGAKLVASFIKGIADNIGDVIRAGGHLIVKILEGIGNQADKVALAGSRLVGHILSAAAKAMLDMTNRIATIVENFINGLATAIRTHGPRLRKAGWNLADAIIDGLVGGIGEMKDRVLGAAQKLLEKLPHWARKILGINSPSKVFHEIGQFTMLGFAQGIEAGGVDTEMSITRASKNIVRAAQKTMANMPDLGGTINLEPTITPVLDLSSVHAEAKNMPDLSSNVSVSADTSAQQAVAILAEKTAADKAQVDAAATLAKPPVTFNQNNYSPEALPAVEIYRRTNNQVSRIKALIDSPVPA